MDISVSRGPGWGGKFWPASRRLRTPSPLQRRESGEAERECSVVSAV